MIKTATNSIFDFHDVCGTSLKLKNTTVDDWIKLMQNPNTPADEFCIYILCRMSFLHAFAITGQTIWTTIELTKAPSIRELMKDCKVPLVYMGSNCFALLRKIPAADKRRTVQEIRMQRGATRNPNSLYSRSSTFIQPVFPQQRKPMNLATKPRTGRGRSSSRQRGGNLRGTNSRRNITYPAFEIQTVTSINNPLISTRTCDVSSPEVAQVLANLTGTTAATSTSVHHPEVQDLVNKLLRKHSSTDVINLDEESSDEVELLPDTENMNDPTHTGKHTSNTTNCEPNVLTLDEPVSETCVVKPVQTQSTDNTTLEPVLTDNPNVNGSLCEISDGYDTSDTTADLLDSFDFSDGKMIDTLKKVKRISSTATVKTAVTNTTSTSSNNENINCDKTEMLNPAPDDDTPLLTDQTEECIEDKASSEHPVQTVRSCEKLPGTDQTENKTEVTQEDPIRKTVQEMYRNIVQVECKFELEKLSEKDILDWMTKENLSVTKGFQIIMKTPVKTETEPITKSGKNKNKPGDDAVDPSANVTTTELTQKKY